MKFLQNKREALSPPSNYAIHTPPTELDNLGGYGFTDGNGEPFKTPAAAKEHATQKLGLSPDSFSVVPVPR